MQKNKRWKLEAILFSVEFLKLNDITEYLQNLKYNFVKSKNFFKKWTDQKVFEAAMKSAFFSISGH